MPASLGGRTRFHGGVAISQARATHVEVNWRPRTASSADRRLVDVPTETQRQKLSLACRSRHSAWLRVGQSGHVELPGRGAPPPKRHARLSGRPRSFPVSPMARHSTSSHSPCRIRQSRASGAGPHRELCVWPAVTFPQPGLAEGPLPLQRGRVTGAPRPQLSTPGSPNPRLAHGPVRCLCVSARVHQIPRLPVCVCARVCVCGRVH